LKEGYKKTHRVGAYKNFKEGYEKAKKKRIEKKKLKLPSLKGKSKIKERERLSNLGRAKEISIKERHNKSQYQKRLSYKCDFWYPL
jgi:hypothetical protein